jgi:hypothetical protein
MIKAIKQCFAIPPLSALKGSHKITEPNINACTNYMPQSQLLTQSEPKSKKVTFNDKIECKTTTGKIYTQHGLN